MTQTAVPQSTERRRFAVLDPLRQPSYRRLWVSTALANLARWMDMTVAGWLALELTNSAWLVALIGFARAVPMAAFGIFGGVIADRLDRRRLIIAAQVGNALVTATLAALLLAGSLEYWHLVAANVLLGLSWSLDWPTRRSFIPDLVSKDQILSAIVADSASMNLTKAIGPIMGGVLIATIGAGGFYLCTTAIILFGLAVIVSLKWEQAAIAARKVSIIRYTIEGLEYCVRVQAILGVLVITMVMNVLFFSHVQLLPVFARDVLSVGPVGFGFLGAGSGIGALLGLVMLLSSKRSRRHGLLFMLGSGLALGATIPFALSTNYYLSVTFQILAGVVSAGFMAYQSTIILSTTSDAIRGRVMGVLALAIGSSPLGILKMGAIADTLGAPIAVAVSGTIGVLAVVATAILAPGLRNHQATGHVKP